VPDTTHLGRQGEEEARDYLYRRGYCILGRDFRCRVGQIDLIARHGQTLIFVEVKTRQAGRAKTFHEAIGPRQRRNLLATARTYCYRYRLDPDQLDCRFDLVLVERYSQRNLTGGMRVVRHERSIW